jgi:hypothetical protein
MTENGALRFRVDMRDQQDCESVCCCKAFLNDVELEGCLMADELTGVAIILTRRYRDALPEAVVLSGRVRLDPLYHE